MENSFRISTYVELKYSEDDPTQLMITMVMIIDEYDNDNDDDEGDDDDDIRW